MRLGSLESIREVKEVLGFASRHSNTSTIHNLIDARTPSMDHFYYCLSIKPTVLLDDRGIGFDGGSHVFYRQPLTYQRIVGIIIHWEIAELMIFRYRDNIGSDKMYTITR